MKYLLRIAFESRRHLALMLITFAAMCLLTIATQLEMFSLKIMTSKGADAFELFAERDGNDVVSSEEITRDSMDQAWQQLDHNKSGSVTRNDAQKYLARHKKENYIDQAVGWLDKHLAILHNLYALGGMLLVIAVFKAVALFAQRFTTRLVSIKVSRDLRQRYFEHIQSLPMAFYQKYNIGALSSRVVTDALVIAESINFGLVNYLQTPFLVITTLILCFMTSWELSLIIFLGLPAVCGPIFLLASRIKRVARQIQRNQERFTSVLIDFLRGVQTVKMFAMEAFSMRKYREQNEQMARLETKSARYDSAARPVTHGMATIVLAMVLFYGIYILHMNISQLLFFCGLLLMFYEPLKKFAEQNTYIQQGIAAAERMYEVLEIHPDIEDSPDAQPLLDFNSTIEFDRVSFRYDDQWVLQDLSFTVRKGETVAIVGPTGAGKSTIVQLLPRLYEPQKGTIRIDGKPLDAYTQKSIREQIAFVPQKPFLFLDTVRENIAFGRDFPLEEVQEAAKRAHADRFIEQLPQGYDTMLMEAGRNLSGGQQQRLAIARALVKKAPILVMDEATSSLDNISENRIKTAIESLRGDVTQIIIAHRLSTIENADRILYLDEGKLIASGSRAELLVSCPPFREMWEMHQSTTTTKL